MPMEKLDGDSQTLIIGEVIQRDQVPLRPYVIKQKHDMDGRYHQLMLQKAQLAVPQDRLRRLEEDVAFFKDREVNLHRRIEGALENVGSQLSLMWQL